MRRLAHDNIVNAKTITMFSLLLQGMADYDFLAFCYMVGLILNVWKYMSNV